MKEIKLVIWDLDDTFWNGTLSEGNIIPIDSNIRMVKELSKRGILNSISSKNNYDDAKKKLIELGVWDYFIFPIINWSPKGENVKNIIEKCQLRNENILFIDDNVSNLKEVEHYNEGINILNAIELDSILNLDSLRGKDDSDMSRLKQYKILEKKNAFKSVCSDNHSFLLQSKIKISFIHDIVIYKERILELINRTNQLNFTKLRSSSDELDSLLFNPTIECTAIKVSDKFGDYGICGFYALNKKNNKLIHFLFSCRILNLGIEEYVYNLKLHKPLLDIAQPVSSLLGQDREIDWIEETEFKEAGEKENSLSNKTRLLFVGGCDLEQLCHYIDKDKFEIITNFNYPNKRGIPIHREHTVYLREYNLLSPEEIKEISRLPFGDHDLFNLKIFSDEYDVLVYSVLMNYTHEVYKHKNMNLRVAYGGYLNMKEMCSHLKFTKEEIEAFSERYVFEGLQKPDEFLQDLEWLLSVINKPIIFLNGAEVDLANKKEPKAYFRHHEMNACLDEFVKKHKDRCQLVDIRKFVKDNTNVKDTIRHYQRSIYANLAEELMSQLKNTSIKVSSMKKVKVRMRLIKEDLVNLFLSFYMKFFVKSGHAFRN